MKQRSEVSKRTFAKSRPYGGGFVVMLFALLLVIACGAQAQTTGGYTSPSVTNPVSSATTPLSSYQSGLISKPNPVDGSSNLVVTGNVGAGKHFRGYVPYRSTTSLSAPLGSTSLDSFMRYTAPSETSTGSAGTYTPYYSSSRTVSTTSPETGSIFLSGASRSTSAVKKQSADATDRTLYPNGSFRVLTPDPTAAVPRLQLWHSYQEPGAGDDRFVDGHPWMMLGQDKPKATAETSTKTKPFGFDVIDRSEAEGLTKEDYLREMNAVQRRLGEVTTNVSELEQSLPTRQEPAASTVIDPGWGWDRQSASAQETLPSVVPESVRREQVLRETARLLQATTGLPAAVDQEVETISEEPTGSQPRLQLYDPTRVLAQTDRMANVEGVRNRSYTSHRSYSTYETDSTPVAPLPSTPPTDPFVDEPTTGESSAADTMVIQPSVQSPRKQANEVPAVTSLQEFARHLQLAQRYFQRGAYQHAADTYALAITYNRLDPRGHLGRSQALLAVGQYDASAASLAKAIELDLSFVLRKVDLLQMIGGPDAFIARFNALDETAEAGDAPMLQLLLAYIYYQMDRPAEARTAIEAARRMLPSSIAIDRLVTTICR